MTVRDGLFIVGIGLLVAGTALVDWRYALVVAGLAVSVVAFVGEILYGRGERRR